MSDLRQSTPPPAPKSNSPIVFIVGGLVVAVGVLAYVFAGGSVPDGASGTSGAAPAISIENNTTAPAPAPEPAPAEPAPAPAEPAPAPAAPAPAP